MCIISCASRGSSISWPRLPSNLVRHTTKVVLSSDSEGQETLALHDDTAKGEPLMTEQQDTLQQQITADAGGAFTCDFAISKNVSPLDIVPMIERDRTFQSARPGFLRKFIPLLIDPASGNFLSGGRYLFRTAQDALQYQIWLWRDFVLDGVAFFDRPAFLNPECHTWDVVGVADLVPYDEHQVVMRTERFRVPAAS